MTKKQIPAMAMVFLLLVWTNLIATAQVKLTDSIPVDSRVKIGRLPNGFTYYIRQNKKPEHKVELRLVLNAGSILEDDDQQGLAHMAEHMAFNGTRNFKKNDIVSFLQSIGVGFGNDLNAYTSFDETVYMLPIPTDKPGNLEKGFQILEDWAHNVTYQTNDINEERNVILEESRLGKGADDRMFRQIYPRLFAGSRYANRLPIGVDSIIRTYNPELIRKFYKDWYRPNLMAAVVVGDVDPATAEALVKKHFSGLVNPVNPPVRTYSDVKPYNRNDGMVVTDKEATNYSVGIAYSAFPSKEAQTVGEYEEDLIKNIFSSILNQRLRDLTQQPNPPFLYGYTYFGSYARNYDQFNAGAGVATAADAGKGLETIVEEIEKAKRFGFTQAELDRVKKTMEAGMDKAYNEREKTESSNYVDEYVRNFLTNEPIPGIAKEREYVKELLPLITLKEINAFAQSLQQQSNYFITLTGPAAAELPAARDLVAAAGKVVARTDIKANEDKAIATELLATRPEPGKILKETADSKLGTRTWELSNGTSVTFKKTDFKDDEIRMGARRYGGTNAYGVADKYNAQYALSVVGAMGYGSFTPTDLQKALAGKTASAGASLGGITDGFSGSSSIKDLETMLQLLYLKATDPRLDTALFRSFIQKNKASVAYILSNPETVFIDTLFKTLYRNNPLAPVAVPRPEYFDQIDMNRAVQIYREHFGDASGMQFVFVGSIDEKILKPLVETYIGGLPATRKKFVFKDNGVRPVKGKLDLTVYKGEAEKSLILSLTTGDLVYSPDLALNMRAVSEVLNIRVIEELREKIQGIYGGGTSVSVERLPYAHYSFFTQLPTGPAKVDTLLMAMKAEIKNIETTGPSKENLDKVKQQWIEQNKVAMEQNGTWLEYILSARLEKKDPDRFLNSVKYINALTPESVKAAAGKIFSSGNVVTAVLQPEKK
ncbi:M16 family metallopeptidase [Niabella drilacis]|uniref:Zinc protease n=1 Tax=Niabella drilacis (strain DSM 25811 / CCM 8410 / CCUG 62505 / LMG 26954 / E90) TaxID=1285928 RepID=A0A1G6T5J9_NIADE|nr:M16 family metallopeptidase [Niabella drilacis]SDD24233.1 zinc protease [Niabella drilacis]